MKVNWDHGRDHIENFVPFVAESLRTAPQPQVALLDLQESVEKDFGLHIPTGALKTIVGRAAKRGYLVVKHGVYQRKDAALSTLGFAETRNRFLMQYEVLTRAVVEFAKEHYSITWTQKEAQAALLQYLQKSSLDVLTVSRGGSPIVPAAPPVKDAEYIVNAFAAHLDRTHDDLLEYLEIALRGRMFADALYYPELNRVEQHFRNVTVYLDTPFLLRAAGFSDQCLQVPCRELLDLLYKQGAKLACFEHTHEEIYEILKGDAARLRGGNLKRAYGETTQHFLDSGFRSSDVELLIERLPQKLRNLHVRLEKPPLHTIPLGVDEKELEETLQKKVGYHRRRALLRDIDSLTAIYRICRGQLHRPIEYRPALFVTTNFDLARTAAEFFDAHLGHHTTPLCLCNHVLSTFVWLKKPAKAPDLPRNRILADCFAAMNPSTKVWTKYLDEIAKLREENEMDKDTYNVLRFSWQARQALMETTLGRFDAFVDGTINQVIAKSTETIIAKEREKR